MDRTLINLLTIVVGGAGLFVAITKVNVPELRATFWNSNPFQEKADAIDSVMTWIFSGVAVFGLLLQVAAEIFGGNLPDRLYDPKVYLLMFLLSVAVMYLVVRLLTVLGRRIAKCKWWPHAITGQRPSFEKAQAIVRNQGWRDDQLAIKDNVSNAEQCLKANRETLESTVSRIERLLEVDPTGTTPEDRLEALREYFS